MVTFDFNGEFGGSYWNFFRLLSDTRVYTIDDDGTLNWAAKICTSWESLEAASANNNAMEEMINKEMKAVFGRAFFGKDDGSISSFQVLLVLENLDGIVSWERLFGIDEAAKTIQQIYEDAHLAAVIQRIRNPGTYPSWKDYVDHEAVERINVIALFAAEIQGIRGANPYWKDYGDYEEYEAYEEVEEKSWRAHTIAHVGRESGGFVGGKRSGDTHTAESMNQIPSEFSYHRCHTDNINSGIQSPTDKAKIIGEDSVRCTLLRDLAVQPLLAKTYAILFPNLINSNLPICERWKGVLSATFRTLRNALKKVRSKKSGGPNIVSNGLSLFKNASKLALGMVIIGNTPAVGAMAPEVVEPGSLQTEDFEKSSNFAFGVVACVGTLVAIIALLKSCNFNWSRHHSLAGASTASAPTGAILDRAVNMPSQTLTVVRSWRETEYREVLVARREEEGAYAS